MAAWVLPARQGGLPFLGHGSHPCQCLIGDRPPWPVTGDCAGSHGLAVLSVSEQGAQRTGGMGGVFWLRLGGVCARFCFSEFSDSGQGWE